MENYYNKGMLKDMEKDVVEFFETFNDDPAKFAGYGHNYFCEEDGGRLLFRLDSPEGHECPVCGHVYTEKKFTTTWVYLYRIRAVMEMMKSAYLYKITKETRYLNYITDTLMFYAENYKDFAVHKLGVPTTNLNEGTSGAGRMMPQGLNESMAIVKILLALDVLNDEKVLEPEFLQFVKDNFFAPAIDGLLAHQINEIHNIKCWVLSAIGMAGAFFNEDRWVNLIHTGGYSITKQLKEGVTSDDFWYEGSIHYNFFTLEGVLSLMYFCKKYGREFGEAFDIPRRMLLASYDYAFENGMLPSPNDGWPNISLNTYAFQYYMALDVYEDETLKAIIQEINTYTIGRQSLPLWDPYHFGNIPLEALSGPPVHTAAKPKKRGSILYPSSNFAFLRNNRVNLFLKYGHNGPSHAHPDKMTFDLMVDNVVMTRDLANAGYGSKICNEWHRMTAAHNTVAIDGGNHTDTNLGQVLHFSENEVSVKADVREGITFSRKFTITETEITDEFTINSETDHTWDYFLHIDGEMDCCCEKNPADLSYGANGYQHIKNVTKIGCKTFDISVKDVKCEITVLSDHDEAFLCETPDNPATRYRKTLVLRKRGKCAEFKVKWKI